MADVGGNGDAVMLRRERTSRRCNSFAMADTSPGFKSRPFAMTTVTCLSKFSTFDHDMSEITSRIGTTLEARLENILEINIKAEGCHLTFISRVIYLLFAENRRPTARHGENLCAQNSHAGI